VAGTTLACGIFAALYAREKTGVGLEVDLSLFSAGVHALSYDISGALTTGADWHQVSRRDNVNPFLNQYQTRDDRWLTLTFVQPDLYWPSYADA